MGSSCTRQSSLQETGPRRVGRRALRRRRFTACVAAFLVPLMVVDPQSVDAMFNEAMAYQTMTAAGIAQVGPTGNATVAYTYDDNGNLHQRYESGDLAATYTFDAENRLVAYVPTTGDAAAYNYDADGIRNSRTVAGVTTWHLTDKNRPYAQVLTETDAATGALRVRYTYGADLISQTRPDPADPHANPPVTRYYHYDGQMSTRQLTDAAEGAATAITDTSVSSLSPPSSVGVGHTAYDAYGNLLAETGETLNAYRYTGEQFDDAIGQYYLRARYYDQAAGRFVSHDPIVGSAEDPRSLHSYLYAHSDPVNRCDPSGMCTLVGLMATTAIIGAIAGVLVGAYVGVKKTGTLLSWTSIKYMVIGLIGGAAIGALIGGALYFSAAGVLRILQAGMRAFWTKLLNPGGHTKSARAAVAGFGLGFVAGLIDPDVIVSIASVGATIAIMLNDFVVRGSMYGRRATAAVVGSYFVQYARLFIFRYIQSTTFIAFAFSFGFAAGHFTGASIRRFYDRL